MEWNKDKFLWREMLSNADGKTSSSAFIGVVLGLIAGITFLTAMIGWFLQLPNTVEIMGKILELALASSVLLGVRKVASRFGNGNGNGNGNIAPNSNSEQIVDTPNKG
jgi:hypothetical protein